MNNYNLYEYNLIQLPTIITKMTLSKMNKWIWITAQLFLELLSVDHRPIRLDVCVRLPSK